MATAKCTECEAMAEQIRVAIAELVKQERDLQVPRAGMLGMLTRAFSSEEKIAELAESFRSSNLGALYGKWTEHRIATGHIGAMLSFS